LRSASELQAESINGLLSSDKDGVLKFDGTPDTETIDRVLVCAHNIVLAMLDLQTEYFKLDMLNEPLQERLRQFIAIWKTASSATQP